MRLLHLLAFGSALGLAGCIGAALEGANMTKDEVVRASNKEAAQSGDAEAQYKVGNSYCCAPGDGGAVYDNQKATEWFCRAAYQDHAASQWELGKIYSGDLVDGVRIIRRAATMVAGAGKDRTNRSLSLMWFELAAQNGNERAPKEASRLREDMSVAEIAESDLLLENWREAPCEWDDVFAEEPAEG